MATTNDLKNKLWTVVEFQHVKPGKGPAFVRTKLKLVPGGKVVERTFNAGVKVEIAQVEKRDMQYLYRDGDGFIFMDTQNYDQITISAEVVGDAANYMLENVEALVAVHDGNPLYIDLPASVELTITYTEPGLQGDRSSGGTKPATVETGIQIQVPLFIKQDEKVLVDTRTGAYLGRANS
jgi:elongation factor P